MRKMSNEIIAKIIELRKELYYQTRNENITDEATTKHIDTAYLSRSDEEVADDILDILLDSIGS